MKKIFLLIMIILTLLACQSKNSEEKLSYFYAEEGVLGYEVSVLNEKLGNIQFANKVKYLAKQENNKLTLLISVPREVEEKYPLFVCESSEINIINKIYKQNIKKRNIEKKFSSDIYVDDVILDSKLEKIKIKVKARKLFNINSMNIEFLCDPHGKFIDAVSNIDNENAILSIDKNKIVWAYSGEEQVFFDDVLFEVEFELSDEGKQNLVSGEYQKFFKINNVNFEQENEIKRFPARYYSLNFESQIEETPLGDYNDDGLIDIHDFTLLKYHYASTDPDIIDKYDIASDKMPIAGKGKKGNYSKIYNKENKDGKIGLGELIVLINNMQVWSFFDLDEELYIDIVPDKQVINIDEKFRLNLSLYKLKDNTILDISKDIITDIYLTRYYNGVEDRKSLGLDVDEILEIEHAGEAYYRVEFFTLFGVKTVDFEVIKYVNESNLRLRAEKNQSEYFENDEVEIIADGTDKIMFFLEEKDGNEYKEIDETKVKYMYKYNGQDREYDLNANIFSTKYAGDYIVWAEYINGDVKVKTNSFKVKAIPGIKYIRVYSEKNMVEEEEELAIELELISMSNENIIKDTQESLDILDNVDLKIETENEVEILKLVNYKDQLSIDLDKKRYIYKLKFSEKGKKKISAIYTDKYGMQIYSESIYNPNGGVVKIDVGDIPKTMIFQIIRVANLNSSYSAIKVLQCGGFDKEKTPTRKKIFVDKAYIKYYKNTDINFNAQSYADLLDKNAEEVGSDNIEFENLVVEKNNFLIYQDLIDDNVENFGLNCLRNRKDKIYFNVEFYKENLEEIASYDANESLKITGTKLDGINVGQELQLYYAENNQYKIYDINYYKVFEEYMPQKYIDFFVEYRNFSSEFLRVYLTNPVISDLKSTVNRREFIGYNNNNLLSFQIKNLEIDLLAKDQLGNNIYTDIDSIEVYVIDGNNSTSSKGATSYIKSYDEYNITSGSEINPLIINDTDSTGKLNLSSDNFSNGKLIIDLDKNFISDNILLTDSVYILIQNTSKNIECLEKLSFTLEN